MGRHSRKSGEAFKLTGGVTGQDGRYPPSFDWNYIIQASPENMETF